MTALKSIRIVLADDHHIVRTGLKRLIEEQNEKQVEIVAEAVNGIELLEKVKQYKPHIALSDVRMPAMDGIQACRHIKKEFPGTAVIAFSAFDNEQNIIAMARAGAKGLLSKNTNIAEVNSAIHSVYEGKYFYSSDIAEKVFRSSESQQLKEKKMPHFSAQELKVLRLVCRQLTSHEIADAMEIAPRTVEDYRHHLQEKTGARNIVGVVVYAFLHGIIMAGDI